MRCYLILSVYDLLRLTTVLILAFSQKGNTPLHESAKEGHLDCVQFLVLKGADVTQRNNVSGNCCQLMVMTVCVHISTCAHQVRCIVSRGKSGILCALALFVNNRTFGVL